MFNMQHTTMGQSIVCYLPSSYIVWTIKNFLRVPYVSWHRLFRQGMDSDTIAELVLDSLSPVSDCWSRWLRNCLTFQQRKTRWASFFTSSLLTNNFRTACEKQRGSIINISLYICESALTSTVLNPDILLDFPSSCNSSYRMYYIQSTFFLFMNFFYYRLQPCGHGLTSKSRRCRSVEPSECLTSILFLSFFTQPYVDLVHGDSPPHRSLLLDYTRTK